MSSIDIHSGKLVEWVVSRFKMDRTWSEKVITIRELISNALIDMPESEEIKKLLSGTYINYFHCLKILEILKETELNTKNIFGQYSSKRMKDWKEIIKLYEPNSFYLIDCAQILNQYVCFDIPAVKKSIEKNNKLINDSIRKEKDYISTIHEANSNLKNVYIKYSLDIDTEAVISSDIIRIQLRKSIPDLKLMIDEIERSLQTLHQASDIYIRFVQENTKSVNNKCLSMLTYLLNNGNTTVYEWKYNKKPVMVGESAIKEISDIAENDEEISWDCTPVEEDFSIIDFGIEVEGELSEEAPTNEMLTILENHDTREMLFDDLYELLSFFSSCIDETKLRTGSILDSIENIEGKWPELSSENLQTLQSDVKNFMEQLASKSLIHLLMLKTNSSYFDSIISRMEHERSVLLKYQNMLKLLKSRVTDAARENVQLEQQLFTLKEQCNILKSQLESSISKAFGNRQVRIVGEISTV